MKALFTRAASGVQEFARGGMRDGMELLLLPPPADGFVHTILKTIDDPKQIFIQATINILEWSCMIAWTRSHKLQQQPRAAVGQKNPRRSGNKSSPEKGHNPQ